MNVLKRVARNYNFLSLVPCLFVTIKCCIVENTNAVKHGVASHLVQTRTLGSVVWLGDDNYLIFVAIRLNYMLTMAHWLCMVTFTKIKFSYSKNVFVSSCAFIRGHN